MDEQQHRVLAMVRSHIAKLASNAMLKRIEDLILTGGVSEAEQQETCRRVVSLVRMFVDEQVATRLESAWRLMRSQGERVTS